MPNVDGAYCAESDMRTGDIAVPSYASKEQYIKGAAREIETALGSIYVTPIVVNADEPKNRPTVLFLEKLNWLLASGRFMLDVSAAGEHDNLHAYGKRMLDEANQMLRPVLSGAIELVGADRVDGDDDNRPTGPMIHNEDSESLVEGFYTYLRPTLFPGMRPQVNPYG